MPHIDSLNTRTAPQFDEVTELISQITVIKCIAASAWLQKNVTTATGKDGMGYSTVQYTVCCVHFGIASRPIGEMKKIAAKDFPLFDTSHQNERHQTTFTVLKLYK
jgi:hypothetical protein